MWRVVLLDTASAERALPLNQSSGFSSKESFLVTVVERKKKKKKTILGVCVGTLGFKAEGSLSARAAGGKVWNYCEPLRLRETKTMSGSVDLLCVCVLVSIPVHAVDSTLDLSWRRSSFKFQISRVHHGSKRRTNIVHNMIYCLVIWISRVRFFLN